MGADQLQDLVFIPPELVVGHDHIQVVELVRQSYWP